MAITAITMSAQSDVTTFLGIPVDGTEANMRQKLIAKGFTPKVEGGHKFLQGRFNGMNVNVHIVTNNDKVWRIMVCDNDTWDETNIKIKYNNLVKQFTDKKSYLCFDDFTIPDSEDISFEILAHKKRYEASFYQNLDKEKLAKDSLAIHNRITQEMLKKFSAEDFANPSEEFKKEFTDVSDNILMDLISKKSVWLMINEHRSKYYISIYYDNLYNQANGEDL